MPSIYRTGTVFAIASELESEGIVVLEAAACGVPIVAVRATSMPELVEESGCGHLVPPGDVHAMADRIVQVLRDPAAQRALGEAGVAMARAHSLALTLDRHEELYQSLLVPAAA
jgi:glycosyltransferase involved in cell wall biosynthesis